LGLAVRGSWWYTLGLTVTYVVLLVFTLRGCGSWTGCLVIWFWLSRGAEAKIVPRMLCCVIRMNIGPLRDLQAPMPRKAELRAGIWG
jgi:hypothetical protein